VVGGGGAVTEDVEDMFEGNVMERRGCREREIRVDKKRTKSDERGRILSRGLGVGSTPNMKSIRMVKRWLRI
jgi:hypothetical protein